MSACDHCDGSVPHHHTDPAEEARRVRARAGSLLRWAGARGPVVALAAAAVALASGLSDGLSSRLPSGDVAAPSPALLAAGAAAWVLVTAVGLVVAGAVHARTSRGVPGRGTTAALAAAAVAAGAATPFLALVVVLAFGATGLTAPWWPSALWVGLGWLLAASVADVVRGLRLRALLLARGQRGHAERAAAARGDAPDEARHLAGTAVGAVVFAGWVVLLGLLPVLAVVAVPAHAGVAARIARARVAAALNAPRSERGGVTLPA